MTDIKLHLNKHCMSELTFLDKTNILCLFDMGSTVNLLSESTFLQSPYLNSLPIHKCPPQNIQNTSTKIVTDKFIEICFIIKEHYVMGTIVPDFGNVIFILSCTSMSQLRSNIDLSLSTISIHK